MKKQTITLTTLFMAISYLAFLPQTRAVSPPPDGCYPNYTTAEGCSALNALTTGAGNTGLGWYALFGTSTGSFNTAVGAGALVLNNADSNTATGAGALLLNTSGTQNVAVGTDAMVYNDTGTHNTAVGAFALFSNIDGFENSAFGNQALYSNQTGSLNNAFGGLALTNDETGSFNNAFGDGALQANVSGSSNTAVGDLALTFSTGDHNTAFGAGAGTDPDIGSNNIYIGDMGFMGDNNVIAIGNVSATGTDYDQFYVGGVVGAELPTADAVPVYIDTTNGRLGTVLVNANKGKPNTATRRSGRHQAMRTEFLKQQKRITELETTVARQQQKFEQQQKQIELLTAGLQKVSAQIEASKAAPRVVVNNP